jgi:hypothetical protein
MPDCTKELINKVGMDEKLYTVEIGTSPTICWFQYSLIKNNFQCGPVFIDSFSNYFWKFHIAATIWKI